ncbi:hypothetical protein [Aneurinibacillus soli]|nr:hypothetical protein [Aneurinibacillus soli]
MNQTWLGVEKREARERLYAITQRKENGERAFARNPSVKEHLGLFLRLVK